MRYSSQDIINALKDSGIEKDDTVFFSTSLGMVGLPPESVKTQEDLNALFLDVLRDLLPDGRVVVPTYSYTFGRSTASELAVFDRQLTPAEIGSFPNFILKQPDAVRSLDPFVSVACIGKNADELLAGISNISYGEGSFFERLVNLPNAKCCSIGLGPNWTPFIHYADYLAKAPHRYDKLFWGYIKDGDNIQYVPWIYSVRALIPEALPYAHTAGREAERAGIWKASSLGRARVYTANCSEYFCFVMDKLRSNKWYLAKGPAVDVFEKEHERGPYANPDSAMYLETGQWIGNFLVPERWHCRSAALTDSRGRLISKTPWIHSMPIDRDMGIDELLPHTAHEQRNCFFNRDWGFVLQKDLTDTRYHVRIDSSFAKGTVPVSADSIYLEEWMTIPSPKHLKLKIHFGSDYDWRKDV